MSAPNDDSGSGSDSDTPAMKYVSLAMIPTLRYLYKNKTLAAAATANRKYPTNGPWLDRVALYQGDITRLEVGAIVNAANSSLLGGGGVDGQIHRAAGRNLLKECKTLGGANTGEAKITAAYDLPSKYIIHAVGPVYSTSQKDIKAAQLEACYVNSLNLAVEHKTENITFCSLSTGIYGYPIADATHVALRTVRDYLDAGKADSLNRVIFCVWSDKDRDVYQELIPQYFPPEPEAQVMTATGEPAVNAATIDQSQDGNTGAVGKEGLDEGKEVPVSDSTRSSTNASL